MPVVPTTLRPVFRAVAATVVPESIALDEQQWDGVEALVDATLRERTRKQQRQLQLFLRLIEWLPLLRYGQTFTALAPQRRERVFAWLQDHPIELVRTGFWGLRTLALLGYYGRPEAARALGYVPDVRGWEAVR